MACVHCSAGELKTIMAVRRRGVPHEAATHNVVYDLAALLFCTQCNAAQLEVYSHDCWSRDEAWDMHWWFGFDSTSAQLLVGQLRECPQPLNAQCECSVHVRLRNLFEHTSASAPSVPYYSSAKEFTLVTLSEADGELTSENLGTRAVAAGMFADVPHRAVADPSQPALTFRHHALIVGAIMAGTLVIWALTFCRGS